MYCMSNAVLYLSWAVSVCWEAILKRVAHYKKGAYTSLPTLREPARRRVRFPDNLIGMHCGAAHG